MIYNAWREQVSLSHFHTHTKLVENVGKCIMFSSSSFPMVIKTSENAENNNKYVYLARSRTSWNFFRYK